MFPAEIKSRQFLHGFQREFREVQAAATAIAHTLYSQKDYVALAPAMSIDGGYFWRHGGALHCGLLDLVTDRSVVAQLQCCCSAAVLLLSCCVVAQLLCCCSAAVLLLSCSVVAQLQCCCSAAVLLCSVHVLESAFRKLSLRSQPLQNRQWWKCTVRQLSRQLSKSTTTTVPQRF